MLCRAQFKSKSGFSSTLSESANIQTTYKVMQIILDRKYYSSYTVEKYTINRKSLTTSLNYEIKTKSTVYLIQHFCSQMNILFLNQITIPSSITLTVEKFTQPVIFLLGFNKLMYKNLYILVTFKNLNKKTCN